MHMKLRFREDKGLGKMKRCEYEETYENVTIAKHKDVEVINRKTSG